MFDRGGVDRDWGDAGEPEMRTIRVEAFALGARYARPKETGWRYVRSGALVCAAGTWTLTTDRRGGEHVDRDSEGVATDYAALVRELGVLEPRLA